MPITIDGTNGITQAGEFNSDSSFGFKNRIINGAMVLDQRSAGAAVTINTTANVYTLDRWNATGALTDGVFTVDQDTTAPTGFINSLKVTVTTADASIGADQSYMLTQFIEGFNVADLGFGTANAKTVTLSFWVQSSVTGTFGGALNNSDNNRNYPFTYTISVANTWEQKSVTIAGDTSGTWLTDSGRGIGLRFGFGMGSNRVATAGAWTGTSQIFGATGQTQLMSTLNATWYITGVQLEVGSTATSFDYRSIGTELALCQRYYYQHARGASQNIGVGCYYNSSTFVGFVQFPVTMRTAPSLVSSNTLGDFVFYRNDAGDTFDTFTGINEPSTTSANIRNNTQASGTAGQAGLTITNNSTSLLAFNSEL
jgi:hypothetical protein